MAIGSTAFAGGPNQALGCDELVSETSPDDPHTYPRLRRMGASPRGHFLQMVRATRAADG